MNRRLLGCALSMMLVASVVFSAKGDEPAHGDLSIVVGEEHPVRTDIESTPHKRAGGAGRSVAAGSEPPAAAAKEKPARPRITWKHSHPSGLSGLEFMQTEVTVAQYQSCVKAGKCDAKHYRTSEDHSKFCNSGHSDRGNHPMNCVDWHGATQFCEWIGGRLPTDEEWLNEASNDGQREYPWGDEPVTCELAVWGHDKITDGCGKDRTWPVCSLKAGNSVSGLCDMAGNVWEWTSSISIPGRPHMVMRGGSWQDDHEKILRMDFRSEHEPDKGAISIGMRCVRSSW